MSARDKAKGFGCGCGWILLVLAALAVALVAFVAFRDVDGLTGSDDDPAPARAWPLTGIPGDPDPGARPALAVKIDDTDNGRPQIGLAEADVVFEEEVEGGLTRLLAVYHSEDPATVGPVRSARSTDLGLLAELGRPLFAWSGANPTFGAAVAAADLVDVGAAAVPDAYRRDGDRRAPYNLLADPADLRAAGRDGDPRPPTPLFAYRSEGDALPAAAEPADGYRASTEATTVEWTWDAARAVWLRTQNGTPHVDAAGTQVAVDNVVVRDTEYRDSGVRDSRGAVVPEAVLEGEGDAWLLTGGTALPGRWFKASAEAVTTFTATDGRPFRLTPGRTWVEVLPPGTGQVTLVPGDRPPAG